MQTHTNKGFRIERETHIEVPREFLWELIQEPTRRTEWDARLTRIDVLTPRPIARDTRVRTTYGVLGWTEIQYTSWQPVSRSAVKSTAMSPGNPMKSLVGSWNFFPHEDGTTTWKTQLVIRCSGGPFAPLLERFMVGPLMAVLTRLSARNLKRLAEAEYTARSSISQRRPAVSNAN